MLGLVCGSFLGFLGFAWDLLRVVVRGFFPMYFGFACISGLGFWGFFFRFLGGGFFCSLGFMGASSGFWVLWGLSVL